MIDCNVISTGSKGNAVLLDSQVLVDCGIPYRRLVEAKVVDKIKYIFLTHQHKDHLNMPTIRRLIQEHPTIRILIPESLKQFCISHYFNSYSFLKYNTSFIPINKWYKIGNFQFSCVPLHHDVPNVAWKLHFRLPQDTFKVLYATDTVSMEGVSAKEYDLYLVEANYKKDDIINRIKEKRLNGEYVYEDRVLKTHLSQEKCDAFLGANAGSNSSYIYMHQHDNNIEGEE